MSAILSGLFGLFGRQPAKPVVPSPPPEKFVPTFEKPIGYGPGGSQNRFINPEYFATQETAEWIMKRLAASEIRLYLSPGNEGPFFTVSIPERWLVWADGTLENAGTLAAIYQRNPIDKFLGVADQIARENVEVGRRSQKETPLYLKIYKVPEGGGGPSGV